MPEESPHSFLQTDAWEEFNRAMGAVTYRVQGLPAGQAGVLAIKTTARRGTFLLVPHVPWFSRELCDELARLARREGCAWVRVCPLMFDTLEHRALFARLGFRAAPSQPHPKLSWVRDITSSDDEILKNMRKTTRHSIRKAEQDVEVLVSDLIADIDMFWNLYVATVQRHHFTPFSKEYIGKEFEVFAQHDAARWFFAKVNGTVTSAAMVVFTKDAGFYHHGASRAEHSTASYLVQWRAIQEAKRRGCRVYNFWGIAPEDQPHHPWAGLTQFKKGFGGRAEAYVPAHDLVLSSRYWFSYVLEAARRRKRNL